jgi:hypothetical protein
MKPFPLNQLDTCADKQVLPCVAGIASKIYQPRSGTKADGSEWSVQDLELEADGVTVKVKVWDHPEIARHLEKKFVTITASDSKGLTALFVHDDTYRGKTTRMLRLTATAGIDFGNSTQQSDAPRRDNRPRDNRNDEPPREREQNHYSDRSQSEPPPANDPPPPPTREEIQAKKDKEAADGIKDAKKELMKLANLHLLATMVVEKVLAPQYKEVTSREMPEDRRGASISSLIIAGERRGLHLNLPTRPFKEGEA